MEKDKSRGIKHIKDKRKYKGNTTKKPQYVPAKTKPNLGSNWDRYELGEENEHKHKLTSSTDFALLANAPISTGSHFQFKSDKINEEEHIQNDDLFCLNLDLLHRSILTVPFYERLDIPKEYFKEQEVKRMDKNASINLESYQKFVKTIQPAVGTEKILKESSVTSLPTNSEKVKTTEKVEDVIDCGQTKDDILELIGTCSLDKEHKDVQVLKTKEANEDLEQWLDDILED